MIIAFRKSVDGIILACNALISHPDSRLIYASDSHELRQKLALFTDTDSEGLLEFGFSSTFNMDGIISQVFSSTGKTSSGPSPYRYINLILRHSKCIPSELVHLIVSCRGDLDVLYSGKTILSRKYYNYMRDVTRTHQRLCMFARPEVLNDLLVVTVSPPHEVADMFCRWLARKNPDMTVAVLEKEYAWIGNGRYMGLDDHLRVPSAFIETLSDTVGTDEVEELWDIYYDSQMIMDRRNIGLAKKMQPGTSALISSMSKKDRYKVEKGIGNTTLDFFDNKDEVIR